MCINSSPFTRVTIPRSPGDRWSKEGKDVSTPGTCMVCPLEPGRKEEGKKRVNVNIEGHDFLCLININPTVIFPCFLPRYQRRIDLDIQVQCL